MSEPLSVNVVTPKNAYWIIYVKSSLYAPGRNFSNFSSVPKDVPNIPRFSNRKWVLIMCTTGNL